ncbi:threonine--tRNA ligase [Engelhardtia mirabilis]|uniref:Threonine--tRNA ligase n=1 Tax=Engelhardtia mirabilis TaxID=2528011 RepID=A0A518BIE0_9BACT|nr:Threonine--tRNA ligase [Planctomycetes bacterium Pla133]QDV01039.1 Threonine--tRNA ligase [Planctomycetes bacterium Pla86]
MDPASQVASGAESAAGADASQGPFPLSTLRHSVSHLMASAVERLYPGTKFGFGPSIEHGFYYDMELPEPLEEKDLKRIEKEMRRIAKQTPQMVCTELSRDEAKAKLAAQDQTYKVEAVDLIPEDETITFWSHGDWADLCEGPHVDRLDREFHFKLLSLAGAYWRGDEKRPMLQRIYGTAFWTKEDLEAHLAWLEQVKLSDHRRIGTDQDLFSVHAEAGAGFVFWHPRLGVVRKEIEDFWWHEHRVRGYQPVYTPHVSREDLFAVSGHLENYGEMMYAPMDIEDIPYRVKPMNCPGHILIYQNRGRSYRELPLRWAELGTVYRFEKSGVVHGMLRVRGFTQDDSHIFCTPDQLADEIAGVLELVRTILDAFGFSFTAYLATRPEKAIGEEDIWERAIDALQRGAQKAGIELELDEGGGAFYGPKIDFKVKDAMGREWQQSTVQCDFNLPDRFDLTYTDTDGHKKRPIMVHRAILGSFERFVGVLIEHFSGKFPFWLAPDQVAVIPIREDHADYARELTARMEREGFRVNCMDDPSHMNKRIKHAQGDQTPFMLIVGEREAAEGTCAVRPRGTRDQVDMPFERFLDLARDLRASRALELPNLSPAT